jgi:hypothetical protein
VTRAKKLGPLILVAAIAALWLVLGRKIPHTQTVHIVLGDAASRVTELHVGYGERDSRSPELTREATFQWAEGAAPRIVTHAPRLADGEYRVEIVIGTRGRHAMVERRVKIEENPVSIDVQEAVP